MSIPSLTAGASLYKSSQRYRAGVHHAQTALSDRVTPQQASWWQCGRCWTRCRVTGQGEDFCDRFCDFWCNGAAY